MLKYGAGTCHTPCSFEKHVCSPVVLGPYSRRRGKTKVSVFSVRYVLNAFYVVQGIQLKIKTLI